MTRPRKMVSEGHMLDFLAVMLRLAGLGLIILAIGHIPLGRYLKWREETARMSPANDAIFHVHNLFICLALVGMGLPCLLDPWILLEESRAGLWGAWSLAAFWGARLYCQWFVYPRAIWHGKRRETWFHYVFTGIWAALTTLYALCGMVQAGWVNWSNKMLPF